MTMTAESTLLTTSPSRPDFSVSDTLTTTSTKPIGRYQSGAAYRTALGAIARDCADMGLAPHVTELAARVLGELWHRTSSAPSRPPGQVLSPQCFPLPRRGVQLEWHAGSDHVEISIEGDGSIGLFVMTAETERDYELSPGRDELPFVASEALGRISDAAWAAQH